MGFREFLNEKLNIDDYEFTYEKSQFGGFRALVLNKDKKTSYLSQHTYKDKETAMEHAKVYMTAYVKVGDTYAIKQVHAFVNANRDKLYKK